ncbi:MAG: 3-deoxy-D-manno-octulosonic acid transferase [Deltaproteobacteria bacterium]|nr:3-deoxy-D-manno-octulosonic acid transferase [Deltaproteobacteria bacterium]MBW2648615.1 3-deoxy-D-manno-octulosonic acid transferase [Deltaproteobacteria bacterium]
MFAGKYRKSIGPKFGLIPRGVFEEMQGSPRIWVHAVSVGEVTAAAPIVSSLREMYPEACIVLSTSTETGQEMARSLITDATSHIYYPLDIPIVVRRVMDRVNPDIFVSVETEIWPNFVRICSEREIKIAMVNGRISPRSFRRYRRTNFFWKRIMNMIGTIGAISAIDASRLEAMGVEPSRIHVLGNAKYDSLAARANDALRDEIEARLEIPHETKVFVAGSTHEGEDDVVLKIYRGLLERYPDMLMIIVPRHPERGSAVLSLAKDAGFDDCITMTEINRGERRAGRRIIIVDVIGELFKVYSLATMVFCGGSLVPRGGQNILEPAAWGKVVLYGPSMEDFMDERERLEMAGGGITVRDGNELLSEMLKLMEDPETLRKRGEAGREIVASNKGAARRYAEMISSRLNG